MTISATNHTATVFNPGVYSDADGDLIVVSQDGTAVLVDRENAYTYPANETWNLAAPPYRRLVSSGSLEA